MSDHPHEQPEPDEVAAAAAKRRKEEQSSSALRYVTPHEDHVAELLGALMMIALSVGLFAVLKGWLDLSGGFIVHGLTVPYILAVFVFPLIYRKQEKIALHRPTGGKQGFWYSILDGLVSVSAAGLATIIFASVFVRWLPDSVMKAWQTYAWFIPTAPYTPTSLVVGAVGMFYGGRDLKRQWVRAKTNRDTWMQKKAQDAVGNHPDRLVLVLDRKQFPHGAVAVPRDEVGNIDFEAGKRLVRGR